MERERERFNEEVAGYIFCFSFSFSLLVSKAIYKVSLAGRALHEYE